MIQSKVHLLDASRPNQRVSVCGNVHPPCCTTNPARMTCKHCRKTHRSRLLRETEGTMQ